MGAGLGDQPPYSRALYRRSPPPGGCVRPTHWVLRTTGTLASLRAGVPLPFPEGRLEEG